MKTKRRKSKQLTPKQVLTKLRKLLSGAEEPQKSLIDVLNFTSKLASSKRKKFVFSMKLTKSELRTKLQQIQHEHQNKRPKKCVHCGHEHLHSKGHYRDGRRRWHCTKCHRSFNDFTGTVLGNIHKIKEMVRYIETDFFQGTAVHKAAEKLQVDERTIFAWRHKIGSALQHLLGILPNECVSVVDFSQEISLKASHHTPKTNYKNPKVKIESLNGEHFINGFVTTDDGGHFNIQLVCFGNKVTDKVGEHFLKRCVWTKKRVIVSEQSKLAELGQGLKRGKRRIVVKGHGGGALCEQWKNLESPRLFFYISQFWGMKFRGVATKYQNNYYATISWITTHFCESNWLENLLSELLSNRDAVRKYQELRNLKLE